MPQLDMTPEDIVRQAIHDLFTQHGEQSVNVLRWLGEIACGWNKTLGAGASYEALLDHNCARRTFAPVYQILNSTDEGREALDRAFRPA